MCVHSSCADHLSSYLITYFILPHPPTETLPPRIGDCDLCATVFHHVLPSHDTRSMPSSTRTFENAVTNTQGPGNVRDPGSPSKVPTGMSACSPEGSYLILKLLEFTGIRCRSSLQLVYSRVVVHAPTAIGELKRTQALLVEPTENPKFEPDTSTMNRYRGLKFLRLRKQVEGGGPILVK